MANPKLTVGDAAPTFEAPVADSETLSLSDVKGRRTILYFYPKDNTPGCTTQACDFRDASSQFADLGYKVVGVSSDSLKSHSKFTTKFDLNFPLLSDSDHAIAQAFGVWREKKNYGRTYTGLVRSTFVIDETGQLVGVYDNVRAKGHVARLLKDLSKD